MFWLLICYRILLRCCQHPHLAPPSPVLLLAGLEAPGFHQALTQRERDQAGPAGPDCRPTQRICSLQKGQRVAHGLGGCCLVDERRTLPPCLCPVTWSLHGRTHWHWRSNSGFCTQGSPNGSNHIAFSCRSSGSPVSFSQLPGTL